MIDPRLRPEIASTMTKILLVEDSKFMRIATERALARAGYEVTTAIDGEHALESARLMRPDLILLDLLLPRLSGQDVLKALKGNSSTASIPVVILSSMSEKNADRLHRDGAFAFLGKEALALDKGSGALLTVLAGILRDLGLAVPPPALPAAGHPYSHR
ncbi:MAG: response regulator [Candidatus Sulfotelmatobacter sp.]